MKKFKWVIQNLDGSIALLGKGSKPKLDPNTNLWLVIGDKWEVISRRCDLTAKPVCIDLKKNGYEIKDGILLKLPRDYYNKKTCDLMMRAWRLIIRSETGER